MTKDFYNAIMKRSRLKNKYWSDKSLKNREKVKICGKIRTRITQNTGTFYAVKKLLRKTKKTYFSNLDTNIITGNWIFLQTVALLFTKSGQMVKKILLLKEEEIFLMIHNFLKHLRTSLQTLFPIWKYLTPVIIFQIKTYIPFQLTQRFLKNTPAFLI